MLSCSAEARTWLGLCCPELPLSPLDYATVQTVGMTLATIMFVLGIIIILSKCPPHLWVPTLEAFLPTPPYPHWQRS